ncbi:hypothetical protein I549_0636 [Mycobacterium avium subsp. avium 2285 (R)]|nr:hypothetical protein I549_0636 [Mycobacterium avium subsp. avium 2285 (R)]
MPGGTIPVRLVDDDLATSLASGGRLDILLAAAEVATSHDVDPTAPSAARCAWRSTRICWSPSTP